MLEPVKHLRGAQEIRSLWEEYEAQQTAEAKIVRELDRIDMVVQANEYEACLISFFFLPSFLPID